MWGMSRGPYTNVPAGGGDDLAADPEGQLTLDHVEPFVLTVMDVQRRPRATWGEVLDHRDPSCGGLRRGLD